MKKTLTVNLGGTVFNIDEDAYRLLDKYLSNLKYHFKKEKGADEIVKDFELRISELFMEKINAGYQVITIEDVEQVIERVGKPEDLSEEKEEQPESNGTSERVYRESIHRKLYRDPDNKILGGVAGGLAAYMGWDATIIRIVMLLLLVLPFIHFPIVLIYLIGWLVIPMAHTASEKLAMRGEKITVENIGKTVTDGFERMSSEVNDFIKSDKPRTVLQKIGDALVMVAGLVIKLFLIILAIVFSPVLFVLAICFFAFVIAAIGLAIGGGAYLYSLLPADYVMVGSSPMITSVFGIFMTLLIGIPLIALVYSVLCQLFTSWKQMSSGLKWTLFALWIVSFIVCLVLVAQNHFMIPTFQLWSH